MKPANVMVDKNGTPYVLDFGIAREIHETMTRVTGKLLKTTSLNLKQLTILARMKGRFELSPIAGEYDIIIANKSKTEKSVIRLY